MTRSLSVLVAAGLALGGCADTRALTADHHFDGLSTRQLAVRVRVTNVTGDWAGIALVADVAAPGAAWASFTTADVIDHWLPPAGPAQRTIGGRVRLDLARDWFRPGLCPGAICATDYMVSLDTPPTAPWSVVVSVTVDGHAADGASVEVLARP